MGDVRASATRWQWPSTAEDLIEEQRALAVAAGAALATEPWRLPLGGPAPLMAGCFVAFAREGRRELSGATGAWAAAVVWRPSLGGLPRGEVRRSDQMLRGSGPGRPRRARDVVDQAVVGGATTEGYRPGLLALREGPLLTAVVEALEVRPAIVLVDATGRDHPRGAGLAVQLGAVTGIPTIGVTNRPLVGEGALVAGERGTTGPLISGGQEVARWVCTRRGARPVLAHAGWRTDPATAAAVALAASTEGARTPVPLGEARRVAREARAAAEARSPS